MPGAQHARRHRRSFLVGLVAAVALVPVVLVGTSFPRGQKSLGLDALFSIAPTGEVALKAGAFARGAELRPGDAIRGARVVRNQTGRVLIVSVRALPSNRDADRLLHTRVLVDGKPLFEGTLGELRSWTEHWFQLERGEQRKLQLLVDVAPCGGRAHEGVVVDVPVELKAEPRYR
jgi:hypothetical protein